MSCSICLEALLETNKATLKCGHSFHYECALMWNRTHANCPLCRDDLKVDDPKYTLETIIKDSKDFGIYISCDDCEERLGECDFCERKFCSCLYNHEHYNCRNPFKDPENIDRQEEIDIMCGKCFTNRRDYYLVDAISNSLCIRNDDDDGDIWYSKYLEYIWKTYYKNETPTQYHDLVQFDDYEDFVSYARTIHESNMWSDYEND